MQIVGYVFYVIAFIDFALSWMGVDITFWLLGSFSWISPIIFVTIGSMILGFARRNSSTEDLDN